MRKLILLFLVGFSVHTIHAQSDSTLKEFTGRYIFPEGGVIPDVTVVLEGDQLSMISTAGTSQLTKLGIDSFTIVEFSGLAHFKRSATRDINAVHIEAAGYILDGVKEEGKGFSFTLTLQPGWVFNSKRNEEVSDKPKQ